MSLVPAYDVSPAKSNASMDCSSPGVTTLLHIKGIEPSTGPLQLTPDVTIILDHSMVAEWGTTCTTFDTLRLACVQGPCVMHTTRPGSYITKNPAVCILLPCLATLNDPASEQVLVVRAQGEAYGGSDTAGGDELWFKVLHGKSHDPKTAVWVKRDMLKSLDGPPSNDLGGRKWKSHASAYLAKDTTTRGLGLETVAKVEAYQASEDKQKVHEKVFDQCEKAMRATAAKMEDSIATAYIEEHLPKITYFREAYEGQAKVLNVPMSDRFRVIGDLPARLDPLDDAAMVATMNAEFQADFQCAARPPLTLTFITLLLPSLC